MAQVLEPSWSAGTVGSGKESAAALLDGGGKPDDVDKEWKTDEARIDARTSGPLLPGELLMVLVSIDVAATTAVETSRRKRVDAAMSEWIQVGNAAGWGQGPGGAGGAGP